MHMRPVKSSQLHAVGYDPATRTMRVQFKEGTAPGPQYDYANVPPELHAELATAASPGTHFHKHVRGKFKHTRLP